MIIQIPEAKLQRVIPMSTNAYCLWHDQPPERTTKLHCEGIKIFPFSTQSTSKNHELIVYF